MVSASPTISMRHAGSGTNVSSGITDRIASTARAALTPANGIGSPITVDIAVESAGKLVSTMTISSPCPIRRKA
jgi:hypothetical protein